MNEDSQWNNKRNQKNNFSGQKPSTQKYNENKNSNYSPSTSYNYQNGKSHGHTKNLPRRRFDRFKKDTSGSNDRLVKQNDIIIKLLKDIRDRLPKQSQEMILNSTRENKIQTPQAPKDPIKDRNIEEDIDSNNEVNQPKVTAEISVTPTSDEDSKPQDIKSDTDKSSD